MNKPFPLCCDLWVLLTTELNVVWLYWKLNTWACKLRGLQTKGKVPAVLFAHSTHGYIIHGMQVYLHWVLPKAHTESSRKVKSTATCQVVLITERENHCGHVKLPDDNIFLFSPECLEYLTLHRIIKNWFIYWRQEPPPVRTSLQAWYSTSIEMYTCRMHHYYFVCPTHLHFHPCSLSCGGGQR